MTNKFVSSSLTFLSLSILAACGGGGSGSGTSSNPTPAANQAPTLATISPIEVKERATLSVEANATDSDGNIASYSWKQTSGTAAELTATDNAILEFVVPSVTEDETITFSVTATDNDGTSASQEVEINILAYQNIEGLSFEDAGFEQCLVANGITDTGYQSIKCTNNSLMTLNDLAHFEDLRELEIESNQLDNVEMLKDNETITHLKLTNASIEDLSPINSLTQLESLELYDAWSMEWNTNSFSSLNFEQQPLLKNFVISSANYHGYRTFDAAKLSKASGLQSLEIKSIPLSNTEDLKDLNNLTSLTFRNSFNSSMSLSFLLNKESLTELNLIDVPVSDFSAVATLVNLKELTLHSNNNSSDFSAVYALQNLELLDLSLNYSSGKMFDLESVASKSTIKALKIKNLMVEELEILSDFEVLEDLSLITANLHSVFHISKLSNLKHLNLANNTQLNDISALFDLANLQSLDLSNNYQIKDLSSLTSMTELESLVLDNINSSINLQDLSDLVSLKYLSISNSYNDDFDFLTNLKNLESINISNAYRLELMPDLSMLDKLEAVVVSNTNLKDLSFLQSNTNLKSIDVSSNQIENLGGLNSLTKIEKLNLIDSPVLSDIEAVRNLSELKEFKISNNANIYNLEALANAEKLEIIWLTALREVDKLTVLENLKNLNSVVLTQNDSLLCESIESLKLSLPNASIDHSSYCVSNPIDWSIIESEQLKQCVKYGSRDISNFRYFNCTVDETTSLAGLEQFKNLVSLNLSGLNNNVDLSILSDLSNLTDLELPELKHSTLPNLKGLSALTRLTVSGDNLVSFNANVLPSSIYSLTFKGRISQLDFDIYLPNLSYINFDYNKISTLTGLGNLPALYDASLNYNELSSLNALYNQSNLARISIYGNDDLSCSDVDGLKQNSASIYVYHWMSCN